MLHRHVERLSFSFSPFDRRFLLLLGERTWSVCGTDAACGWNAVGHSEETAHKLLFGDLLSAYKRAACLLQAQPEPSSKPDRLFDKTPSEPPNRALREPSEARPSAITNHGSEIKIHSEFIPSTHGISSWAVVKFVGQPEECTQTLNLNFVNF